jgi:hypothetical protein
MMLPYLLCLENQFLVVWVNFSLCCSLMFSIKGQTLTWQLHMSDNYKTEIKNKCHQLFYHFWGSVWFHIDLTLILLVFRKSVFLVWSGIQTKRGNVVCRHQCFDLSTLLWTVPWHCHYGCWMKGHSAKMFVCHFTELLEINRNM